MERAFVVLTARVWIATPTGNIPEASKVETPLYSGHFRWHQWCPQYSGSTVLAVAKQVFRLLVKLHKCHMQSHLLKPTITTQAGFSDNIKSD